MPLATWDFRQDGTLNKHPKARFSPLCDLHHGPMRRVMREEGAAEEAQSFHQCERRGCSRIFSDDHGYTDYADGQFDVSRESSRECPTCGGTLYLAEVDQALKEETWECAEMECNYAEDIPSPSSR
jgi:ssDNA-binding Zn-finger/Zn-ribbon topoisomerase 1